MQSFPLNSVYFNRENKYIPPSQRNREPGMSWGAGRQNSPRLVQCSPGPPAPRSGPHDYNAMDQRVVNGGIRWFLNSLFVPWVILGHVGYPKQLVMWYLYYTIKFSNVCKQTVCLVIQFWSLEKLSAVVTSTARQAMCWYFLIDVSKFSLVSLLLESFLIRPWNRTQDFYLKYYKLERAKKKEKNLFPWLFMLSINLLFSPSLTIDLPNHLSGFQSFHDKRIWAREYCRPRLLLFQENLIDLSKCSFFEVLLPGVLCFTALELTKEISTCDLLRCVLVLWCLLIPSQLLSSQFSSITSLWTFSPR